MVRNSSAIRFWLVERKRNEPNAIIFDGYCVCEMSHDVSGKGQLCTSFSLKKKIYKDYNVVYAGVCSKQACFIYNWRT